MTLRTRLEGWWWPRSQGPRRLARALLRRLATLKHRLRSTDEPRIVWLPADETTDPGSAPEPPRIALLTGGDPSTARVTAERAAASDPDLLTDDAESARFHLVLDDTADDLPAETVEALLLAAVACDVDLAVAGPAQPAESHPDGRLVGPGAQLLRTPRLGETAPEPVGRAVPWIVEDDSAGTPRDRHARPFLRSAGLDLLTLDARRIVHRRVRPVDHLLADLPPRGDGRRTALFLLPYLAVGGAERLLFDLLDGLRERYRLLVVTIEPHRRALGQTVDRCRALADAVYTLGDWLPRPAHAAAIRYLLRRHAVESLVSWNGTVLFYDSLLFQHGLTDGPAAPRILAQLYHHEGAWTARTAPPVVDAVDVHLAVNREIARSLVEERGAEAERVALVHHGVAVPTRETTVLDDGPTFCDARRARRGALGLPDDALVFGAFLRFHPQKRPLDLVELARRLESDGWWLLLVGGGPLDAAVDEALARRPAPNIVRRPMTREPLPLYDAVDVCVSTSSYEGLPVFLLDALARGIPCVATAVGDVPLLLEAGGGVLVEQPGDLDAFTGALRALGDPRRRRTEGEAGRAVVAERFGLERYRADYENLIFPSGGAP
ncbi:MAG: glycosyltransferase [Acidobacteriota bacterium]